MLPPPAMVTTKNRIPPLFLPLLLLALVVAGCTPRGARALLEGRRLLNAGDPTNAVARLQVATALLPTNAVAWNYLGLACHQARQTTNALAAYHKALSLQPNLYEARFNLGCLYFEQGRFEAAKTTFTGCTVQRPNDPAGWLWLGWTQLRGRDSVGADRSFREVLRLQPQQPQALNGLGLGALQRNRPRDAVQFFTAALKAQPGYRPALLNLALTWHHSLRNPTQALSHYREYLALTPRAADWEAVNTVVRALDQELAQAAAPPVTPTNAVAATPAAPPVTAPKPEPPAAHPPAAPSTPAAAKTTPPPPAPQPVTVILPPAAKPPPATSPAPVTPSPVPPESQPPSPPPPSVSPPEAEVPVVSEAPPPAPEEKRGFLSRMNPVNLFRRDPKPEPRPTPLPGDRREPPAMVTTKQVPPAVPPVVEITPPPASPAPTAPAVAPPAPRPVPRYTYLSPAPPAAGDRAAAERTFTQAVEAHQAGRLADALRLYHAATQADPAMFEAYYNLGLAASQAGQTARSLTAYEQALALQPDAAEARYNFALGLKQAGYPADAANELNRVLAAHPEHTNARIALANLYAQQLGQPGKAREHYRQVLERDPRHPQADTIRHWLVQNPG